MVKLSQESSQYSTLLHRTKFDRRNKEENDVKLETSVITVRATRKCWKIIPENRSTAYFYKCLFHFVLVFASLFDSLYVFLLRNWIKFSRIWKTSGKKPLRLRSLETGRCVHLCLLASCLLSWQRQDYPGFYLHPCMFFVYLLREFRRWGLGSRSFSFIYISKRLNENLEKNECDRCFGRRKNCIATVIKMQEKY